MSARRSLYAAARILGDIEAAKRGPSSYARRVVRRRAYRATNGLLAQVLRSVRL